MKTVLAFLIGLFAVGAISALFSLKTKGLFRFLLNSLLGACIMLFLSVVGVKIVPVNPISALIVGATGVPGLIAVAIIAHFL